MPDEPRYRAWTRKVLDYGAHVCLLALLDGEVVGFFAYSLDHNFSIKPVAVMGTFFVAKAHRRSAVPAILFELGIEPGGRPTAPAPSTRRSPPRRSPRRALENMFKHHGFAVIGTMMGRAL